MKIAMATVPSAVPSLDTSSRPSVPKKSIENQMNPSPSLNSASAREQCASIKEQIARVVAADENLVETLLISMVAGGHTLIEGIPGIGKTLLARTMARCLGCEFRRIQFTNDLMPSDIVGTAIWRPSRERFTFSRGPLFSNIVLADEINRTSPRTLSCLLEAMENGTVSIEGRTVELAEPFLVWATRNPIEFHGTYPIPEAALDRFLVRVELTYPDREMEEALYLGRNPEEHLEQLEPVLQLDELRAMMAAAKEVSISEPVSNFCYRVVDATRHHSAIVLGASPRAALGWIHAARARAFLDNRTAVLPDDLIALARPVLAHRISLLGSGEAGDILGQILSQTPVEL